MDVVVTPQKTKSVTLRGTVEHKIGSDPIKHFRLVPCIKIMEYVNGAAEMVVS